ncbi:MAG: holo-ACP synthase [Phycisphaerales bacterium]
MPLIAHAIDIVHVPRIARILHEQGERFLSRVFTPAESQYALSAPNPAERLAARFAAKEAAFKALHTGWPLGVAWTDVEVAKLPSGAPVYHFHNAFAQLAHDRGAVNWLLSLSHSGEYAIASAIASSD